MKTTSPTAGPNVSRRALPLVAALLAHACRGRSSGPHAQRCAFCGMRVPADSHWAAGARDAQAQPIAFDTPACLFRYRHSGRARGMRDEWVTEYYGPAGRRTNARAVRYVAGSDAIGPMGADLIPVDPAHEVTFMRDHHGQRAYSFAEISAEVVRNL